MSIPTHLEEALESAEDAFTHATGPPTFEPGIDPKASDDAIRLQKACRLLVSGRTLLADDLYGAVVEQSFIAIEHSISSYLIGIAGIDSDDLRDHHSPYDIGRKLLPLDASAVDRIKALYRDRRTDHYYDTTISTESQARAMLSLANEVHVFVTNSDSTLRPSCQC